MAKVYSNENCSVEGCPNPRAARGYCATHYSRWRAGNNLETPIRPRATPDRNRPCSVEGCDKRGDHKGYCLNHYSRWRRNGDPNVRKQRTAAELERFRTERKTCERCGRTFGPRKRESAALWAKRRYCGQNCARRKNRTCSVEGCEQKHFGKGFCWHHYCSAFPRRHQPWNDRRRANYHKRRARKTGSKIPGDPVLREEIRARDHNRCQLCRKKMPVPDKPWPHDLSPSIDHLIPLEQGGPDTPANAQLAHLACNVRKGNRGGGEQLRFL